MRAMGRLLIDETGVILLADQAFCQTLGRFQADIVGSNVLDYMAPADRDRCVQIMAEVIANATPRNTVKRLVKPDGLHVWVESRLTRCADAMEFEIVMQEAERPAESIPPVELLRLARILFHSRRGRIEMFEADLFPDHAWDILIAAYISEAEGRVLTTAELHVEIGVSLGNASRWLRALSSLGLVEYEDAGSTTLITAPFRLSSIGHARFERYLTSQFRAFEQREVAFAR